MISSILLAAGQSTRMGRPKPLLPWGDESLIRYQMHQLEEAGVDEIIVVLGYRADDVHREIRDLRCRVVVNARYHTGRAISLQMGAKAVSRDTSAIVIVNVDQPRPAEVLRQIIAAHDGTHVATRPAVDGHHGHPVVVSGSLREELMAARDEDGGLRGVLEQHADEILDVPANDVTTLDMNTPEEYQAALRTFGFAG